MTFTLGRGTDLLCSMIGKYMDVIRGTSLDEILSDIAGFTRRLMDDSQLRWYGPEKGSMSLSIAAISNACWDVWAKLEGKPVWKLIVDMDPEFLVKKCADWKYMRESISEEEAIAMLKRNKRSAAERERIARRDGFPVYTTSAGWMGYSDERIRSLCKEYMSKGYNHFKMKVGGSVEDDRRRAKIIRDTIGPNRKLMMDANQVWEADQAINWMKRLAEFDVWWIEEPTHPDDILGHKKIADALRPIGIGVATGEVAANKVMF